MKVKFYIFSILLFFCTFSYAQIQNYDYKRELIGVDSQWHKLVLPNVIFEKTNENVSDIRIFGISPSNDTIEAPFFLQKSEDKRTVEEVAFQIVNQVKNKEGRFYTLALSQDIAINQIVLKFKQNNFDWQLKLEGSQDQKEWFTIVDDYRILSIRKNATDYQFTTVDFQHARYPFFRIFIKTKEAADLIQATLSLNALEAGYYQEYNAQYFVVKEDKKRQQTIIEVDLGARFPIHSIDLDVDNNFDYYRPIHIEYLVDSFKTEKGWRYNYKTLKRTTLSSIEEQQFEFTSTLLQKLKITITNRNNQPLLINSVKAKGPVYEILARFTEAANYFLVYGKAVDRIPSYDISHFSNDSLNEVKLIELGMEQMIEKVVLPQKPHLFENKAWLWGIMGIIMLLLGWFSVKMIKNS